MERPVFMRLKPQNGAWSSRAMRVRSPKHAEAPLQSSPQAA
jgi:hypothetical protein